MLSRYARIIQTELANLPKYGNPLICEHHAVGTEKINRKKAKASTTLQQVDEVEQTPQVIPNYCSLEEFPNMWIMQLAPFKDWKKNCEKKSEPWWRELIDKSGRPPPTETPSSGKRSSKPQNFEAVLAGLMPDIDVHSVCIPVAPGIKSMVDFRRFHVFRDVASCKARLFE